MKNFLKTFINFIVHFLSNLSFPYLFHQLNKIYGKRTCVKAKAASSTVGGFVFGMASIMVMPPASAAAVHELQSSLCVAPGSLTWTCTSIKPERNKTIFIFNQVTTVNSGYNKHHGAFKYVPYNQRLYMKGVHYNL